MRYGSESAIIVKFQRFLYTRSELRDYRWHLDGGLEHRFRERMRDVAESVGARRNWTFFVLGFDDGHDASIVECSLTSRLDNRGRPILSISGICAPSRMSLVMRTAYVDLISTQVGGPYLRSYSDGADVSDEDIPGNRTQIEAVFLVGCNRSIGAGQALDAMLSAPEFLAADTLNDAKPEIPIPEVRTAYQRWAEYLQPADSPTTTAGAPGVLDVARVRSHLVQALEGLDERQ